MKKITLLLFCGLFSVALFAQEQQVDFNRWSIELEAGVHKPGEPFNEGYYTSTPDFFQGGLGVRYMLSNRFGLKLDVGYNNIEGADGSLPFKTRYMRYSLQGVANAGDILNFRDWTNTLNLLLHVGGGYSRLTPQEPIEKSDDTDEMGHIIFGITPQVKLTDHIVLTGDLSAVGNISQDYNWDGIDKRIERGFDGILINGSLGLTFYLGSAEQHADWYTGVTRTTKLDSLDRRLSDIEDQMLDSDMDGVPNYLDKEPNTVNGVAVNTKGVAVDRNQNGVPDELEDELDERFAAINNNTSGGGAMITDLLNKGYVNVYFKFDSTEPEPYSLNAINYLITYMRENTSAEAELIGYADEIGNVEYNAQLSEARAERVKEIMVAAGISAERLTITGNGEDTSVDKSSQPARQLVRRVTFRLK